jgi:hypothetical protein
MHNHIAAISHLASSSLKDFMEAGKNRLIHDTVRDATKSEVQDIKRSTYYCWLKRLSEDRLKDKKGDSTLPYHLASWLDRSWRKTDRSNDPTKAYHFSSTLTPSSPWGLYCPMAL